MRSSQQQKAVDAVLESLQHAKEQPQHLMLEAVAGAGKTHTLLEIIKEVHAIHPNAKILLLAFNLEMAQQLSDRLPSDGTSEVHTLHAFGLYLCNENPPPTDENDTGHAPKRRRRTINVDPDKAYRIWRKIAIGAGTQCSARNWSAIRTVVDRFRQEGEEPNHEASSTEMQVLDHLVRDRHTVDHEDQIYHPVVHRYRLPPEKWYDLVLVDESQLSHKKITLCVGAVRSQDLSSQLLCM